MKIQLATVTTNKFWGEETVLLAKTLRKFGGGFSQIPLTVFSPHGERPPSEILAKLEQLGLSMVEFSIPEEALKFPLGLIPFGAAAAEEHFNGQADVLIWLLPDTLIVNPPTEFDLPDDKILGYRPVHHQNIGSSFDQPPDEFWQTIYRHTEVPEDQLFPMETCYREMVRPYFNAGILAVRPESGILQQWADIFIQTYQHSDFTPFFSEFRFAIFMHQAILAGVILNQLAPEKLVCFPESYNYPLHMHNNYPKAGKVNLLAGLVTARYENTKDLPEYLSDFEEKDQILSLLRG